MKKILLIAVCLMFLGFISYVVFIRDILDKPDINSSTAVQTDFPGTTLKDLFKEGTTNRKCTFEGESIGGTIYLTKDKVRGDFESLDTGVESHIIIKDGDSYYWSGTNTKGSKEKFDITTLSQPQRISPSTFYITAVMDYKCENWNTNNAAFAIPKQIQF